MTDQRTTSGEANRLAEIAQIIQPYANWSGEAFDDVAFQTAREDALRKAEVILALRAQPDRPAEPNTPTPPDGLAETLKRHAELLANTPMKLSTTEWSIICNDILAAADALSRQPVEAQTVEEWQDLNGLSADEMPNGPVTAEACKICGAWRCVASHDFERAAESEAPADKTARAALTPQADTEGATRGPACRKGGKRWRLGDHP